MDKRFGLCFLKIHSWPKWSEPIEVEGTIEYYNDFGNSCGKTTHKWVEQRRTCLSCGLHQKKLVSGYKPKGFA